MTESIIDMLQDLEKYGFRYKGTHKLDFSEFPLVENVLKEGEPSNIITMYDTNHSDEKQATEFTLFPTMYKGISLGEEEINNMLKQGLHFGVYSSKKELDKADYAIHQYFERLKFQ